MTLWETRGRKQHDQKARWYQGMFSGSQLLEGSRLSWWARARDDTESLQAGGVGH